MALVTVMPSHFTFSLTPFIPLGTWIFPAPLSTVVAVLITAGLWFLGHGLAKRLWHRSPDGVQWALGFMLVTATIAGVVQLLGLSGWGLRPVLATLGGLLMLAGVRGVFETARSIPYFRRWVRANWSLHRGLERRLALIIVWVVPTALTITALGPPIGADAMLYHLAEPVRWLGAERILSDGVGLSSRLVGLGEVLCWLGIVSGTDVFGAMLQCSGMAILLIAVPSLAETHRAKLLAALLVVACPLMLTHVPNLKPFILPVSAVVLAPIALLRHRNHPDNTTVVASVICLVFAIGQKYIFILSGGVVGSAVGIMAWRAGHLRPAILTALSAFLLLDLPLYLDKLVQYGDPISPLLAHWLSVDDPDVIEFLSDLIATRYPGGHSLLYFLIGLAFPIRLDCFDQTLGIGMYAFVLALSAIRRSKHTESTWVRTEDIRQLLIIAATLVLVVMLLGERTGRSLMEAYFLAAAAAVIPLTDGSNNVKLLLNTQGKHHFALWLHRLLTLQGMVILIAAITSATTMFPGALTPSLRDHVMTQRTSGYAATQWLNTMLPPDATLLIRGFVNQATITRRYVNGFRLSYTPDNLLVLRMRQVAEVTHATHMLFLESDQLPEGLDLSLCMRPGSERVAEFSRISFNPFRYESPERYHLITLDWQRQGCAIGMSSQSDNPQG